jgi:hypothetical protein
MLNHSSHFFKSSNSSYHKVDSARQCCSCCRIDWLAEGTDSLATLMGGMHFTISRIEGRMNHWNNKALESDKELEPTHIKNLIRHQTGD